MMKKLKILQKIMIFLDIFIKIISKLKGKSAIIKYLIFTGHSVYI